MTPGTIFTLTNVGRKLKMNGNSSAIDNDNFLRLIQKNSLDFNIFAQNGNFHRTAAPDPLGTGAA